MSETVKIVLSQARKLVLHSSQLSTNSRKGDALSSTREVLNHLGYVQIDTISVVERAHHHVLWSRSSRYLKSHLDQLVADRSAFEYWAHAAAFLPTQSYRFSLPRKHAIKSGAQEHWFERDERLMRFVRDRIQSEGPLMAKDFEHRGERLEEWQSKPAKKALVNLFMQGDLMISQRRNFHKVYDLTERVLPGDVDTKLPSENEYARFLIRSYLQSNGLAQPGDFGYLLKGVKTAIRRALDEMVESKELIRIQVGNLSYFALPESLALLDKRLSRNKVKILSPFDNLLIQRHRMRDLFDFDYQIECYVPKAKRKFGYFTLPLLWGDRLVGRMDCKAERKKKILQIRSLHFEGDFGKVEGLRAGLRRALEEFAQFNECERVEFGSGVKI